MLYFCIPRLGGSNNFRFPNVVSLKITVDYSKFTPTLCCESEASHTERPMASDTHDLMDDLFFPATSRLHKGIGMSKTAGMSPLLVWE